MRKNKSTFPRTIENMIAKSYNRGLTSREAAEYINKTKTARKLRVQYQVNQIASKFGSITKGQ
jgi:hypothetical protein